MLRINANIIKFRIMKKNAILAKSIYTCCFCLLYLIPYLSIAQSKLTIRTHINCGAEFLSKSPTGSNQMPPPCAEITTCHMPEIRDGYLYESSQAIKIIRTKVRIIRETNGTNPAVTKQQVAMQMHHLNLDYAPYGIQFTYIIDYIDDSSIRTITGSNVSILIAKVTALMAKYVSEEDKYCNIFVGTAPLSLGIHPWFPQQGNHGIFMSENLQFYPRNNRSSLTHEMGHVLGLLHTFVGYSEIFCTNPCAENMVQNGDLTGDFCSDTPPQDQSFTAGFTPTIETCNNIPFDSIPHINYMSYSDNKLEFTPQQVARMHCYLESFENRSSWIDDTNPDIPYIYEDDFGYSFIEEEMNPSTDWVDIISKGVSVNGLLDDNAIGPFNLDFDLSFYGKSYNKIYIASNGYVSFSRININAATAIFPSIPTQDNKNGFIAPFMADLNFTGNGNKGKVFFWTNRSDSLVVTYQNVPFFANGIAYSGDNTFQMIYSSTNNQITYQYLNMDDYYGSSSTPTPSTIGIESPDGKIGLEINNYRIPRNNTRIKIGEGLRINTSVENIKASTQFRVYPNPANDFINISLV